MAGLLAHMMLPFSSQAQKTAFTQWLDHNVVASGNENEVKLRNSIRELPEQSGNFWILVQHASELVANHKDDFRIGFSFSDNEKQPQRVSTWLIGQWNVFQNQQTGQNAILPEITQPFQKWISGNTHLSAALHRTAGPLFDLRKFVAVPVLDTVPGKSLLPLISGISINAP
jgi:hypothetical protein